MAVGKRSWCLDSAQAAKMMMLKAQSRARKLGRFVPRQVKRIVRHAVRVGSVPVDGTTSVIIGYLDFPPEPSSIGLSDSLSVAGWAYSAVTDIEKVEAFLDGEYLGTVEYGIERSDVANSLGNAELSNCGYASTFLPRQERPGSKTLSVKVTDRLGNTQEYRRTVQVEAIASRPKMHIDDPHPTDVVYDRVKISGWIYDPNGRNFEIRVVISGKVVGTVPFGTERLDVYQVYKAPHTARCGFFGYVQFTTSEPGYQLVVVQARDGESVVTESQIMVQVVHELQPLAEIDRAVWQGDSLEVEGWAVWPARPQVDGDRRARFFLNEDFLGEARVHLYRTDIIERFPTHAGAARSGFRFTRQLAPQAISPKGPQTLSVEFEDECGRLMRRSVHVVHKATTDQARLFSFKYAFLALVDDCRDRLDHEPSVLDWNTGLKLEHEFPDLAVFSPTLEGKPRVLPYIDRTIDIVAVAASDEAVLAEAQRVAALAVVIVEQHSASLNLNGDKPLSSTEEPFRIWWQPDTPTLNQLPTASIVLTAFNKIEYTEACIRQIQLTIPRGVQCEIVVVDDMSTDETYEVLQKLAAKDDRIKVVRNDENVGFLVSSNRGAEEATGDVIVFLNNDTLPQPGWLAALLRTLRDLPDAGAVGGKLVYPDGTLQEAGGLVFSDGSAANYGKGDPSADAPLYSYLREVDYCSGAALATWSKLFHQLGGFDLRYRPIYYEDTDYCFKVREAGYRVYYQPDCRVVHLEGLTSGTDVSTGLKRYQLVNRQKFSERWQEALTRQAPPPSNYDYESLHRLSVRFERELSAGRRRALVYAPRMPEFDREAGSKRTFDLIRLLRETGWAVSFVAENAQGQERYFHTLRQLGVATYAGPGSNLAGDEYIGDFGRLLKAELFDLAIVAFWSCARKQIPAIRSFSPQTRIVVDSIDLHFLRQARRHLRKGPDAVARSVLDWDYAWDMIGELNTYAEADAVLTVSEKEAALINDFTGNAELAYAVPDMETIRASTVPFEERSGIVFVGNFRHPPNAEAVEYLCKEVVPLLDPDLLAHHPISIVGNDLNANVAQLAKGLPHVRLVGWVPSVVPYLHQSRIAVVPVLHGAGTKRKLIQALTAGTPTVSTSIGVEGLDLRDGEDVLVADRPEAFALAMTHLLTESYLWEVVVKSGRHRVSVSHDSDSVGTRFAEVIAHVMSQGRCESAVGTGHKRLEAVS